MWKKVLLMAGCVIAGLVVGGIAVFLTVMPNMAWGMFMMQGREVYLLGQAAEEAYFNEPNDVAIWAMTTYAATLDRLAEERKADTRKTSYSFFDSRDNVITHARLGSLYHRMGMKDKAQEQFSLAAEYDTDHSLASMKTEEDWLKFVKMHDTAVLTIARQDEEGPQDAD